MTNAEVKDKIAELEAGGTLTRDQQLELLRALLRANRRILQMRAERGEYVTKAEQERRAQLSAETNSRTGRRRQDP